MKKHRELVRIYDINWENDGGDYDQTTAEIPFDEYNTTDDCDHETIKEWLEDDGDCNVIDFKYEFLEGYDENNH